MCMIYVLEDIIGRFIEFVEGLPEETTREYEVKLVAFGVHLTPSECEKLSLLLQHSYDEHVAVRNTNIRFAAFFALCNYYRRMKHITQFKDLVDAYGNEFRNNALYPHLVSILYKQFETLSGLEQSIIYAEEAVAHLPNQVGVLHNYAETIICVKEQGGHVTDEKLAEAYQTINKVIYLSKEYAKFYCTRGRILAALGKISEAKEAILQAIDKEDSTKPDYAIRISDYQYHLIRIQTIEFSKLLSSKVEATEENLNRTKLEVEQTLNKVKTENLQILGFFTAIISFTIGSINLLAKQSFIEAALLIIILTGALLLGYAGFSTLIQTKTANIKLTLLISLIGLLLIVGSFFGHHYLK
jgi:tetratricopeptide (TPR) repeat protein